MVAVAAISIRAIAHQRAVAQGLHLAGRRHDRQNLHAGFHANFIQCKHVFWVLHRDCQLFAIQAQRHGAITILHFFGHYAARRRIDVDGVQVDELHAHHAGLRLVNIDFRDTDILKNLLHRIGRGLLALHCIHSLIFGDLAVLTQNLNQCLFCRCHHGEPLW